MPALNTINSIILLAPMAVVFLKWYAIVSIYVIICAFVANLGSKRLIGFWGTLVLSIVLTPIVVFLLLLVLDRTDKTVVHQ